MLMKKITRLALLLSLLLLFLSGCGCAADLSEKSSQAAASYEETEDSESLSAAAETKSVSGSSEGENAAASSQEEESSGDSRKLIYTADLNLETKDYDSDKKALEEKIESYQGLIQSESETDSDSSWYSDQSSGSLRYLYVTVLIPADDYQDFLEEASGLGHMTNRSQNVENISRQYSDNEQYIAALEKEEVRLQEMMDQADSIEDMIAVEERLTSVETELNQAKTAKSSMDQSLSYSTVYISLREVKEYKESGQAASLGEKLLKAVKGSVHFFGQVIEFLLYLLIYLLPFAILAGIVLLIVFGSIHHAKKKKAWKKAIKENQTDQEKKSEEKTEK